MKGFLFLAGSVLALAFLVGPGLRTSSDSEAGDAASDETKPSSQAQSEPPAAPRAVSGDGVVVARGPEGHFTTQARVNGAAIPMVIDSGASLVVLRREDALAAGISVFPSEFTGTAQTAGGPVKTKRVIIDRLAIAGIERRNVAAAVVDADLPMSLLGQSFLAQLSEVHIADDTMVLR